MCYRQASAVLIKSPTFRTTCKLINQLASKRLGGSKLRQQEKAVDKRQKIKGKVFARTKFPSVEIRIISNEIVLFGETFLLWMEKLRFCLTPTPIRMFIVLFTRHSEVLGDVSLSSIVFKTQNSWNYQTINQNKNWRKEQEKSLPLETQLANEWSLKKMMASLRLTHTNLLISLDVFRRAIAVNKHQWKP